jgi:hypothetical protein
VCILKLHLVLLVLHENNNALSHFLIILALFFANINKVCGSRIAELQEFVLLRPGQLGLDMMPQEIVAGSQSAAPCISDKLNAQPIGVHVFIARSTCPPLPQLLQETLGVSNDIIICSHPFSWFPWLSSFGAVKKSLPKKISIRITAC